MRLINMIHIRKPTRLSPPYSFRCFEARDTLHDPKHPRYFSPIADKLQHEMIIDVRVIAILICPGLLFCWHSPGVAWYD
ncbi:hypothetical protein CC78DRAFT_36095 [Lojkania enalia]|uniref:Uncharacterized protein n=1 Tax=Lojkania enalia TaxID=147567 RepID=A0A9P4KG16_9PLEO|nr:hypothetical protein CC78DRAFT_36095 [Didymosphaeria enalia]